jgi:hypothetical protein
LIPRFFVIEEKIMQMVKVVRTMVIVRSNDEKSDEEGAEGEKEHQAAVDQVVGPLLQDGWRIAFAPNSSVTAAVEHLEDRKSHDSGPGTDNSAMSYQVCVTTICFEKDPPARGSWLTRA